MSRYLEEAAVLLRKAAEDNEKNNMRHPGRVELAREFATLAAIDKGILPAYIAEAIFKQTLSERV